MDPILLLGLGLMALAVSLLLAWELFKGLIRIVEMVLITVCKASGFLLGLALWLGPVAYVGWLVFDGQISMKQDGSIFIALAVWVLFWLLLWPKMPRQRKQNTHQAHPSQAVVPDPTTEGMMYKDGFDHGHSRNE